MNRHQPTGRRMLGLGLAFVTISIWGVLPVFLKLLVVWLDPFTITWFRFLTAGILMAPVLLSRHGTAGLKIRGTPLLVVGIVGLCGNYVIFLTGLRYISPGTSQVIIQLAPMMVLLGALVLFKEPFRGVQWLGLGLLVVGLGLFFNMRYGVLLYEFGKYSTGVLLVALSAVFWAVYILAQKQILIYMKPEGVLLYVYFFGSTLLLPMAHPGRVLDLDGIQLSILIASAIMTMVSYLSFAEALRHVEASRIGVVVSLGPLLTLASVRLGAMIFPVILVPEPLNIVSAAGALLVVVGSMLGSFGKREV